MGDNKQNDRHKSPKETIRAYCVYCNGAELVNENETPPSRI
jgi:hypothetical protein